MAFSARFSTSLVTFPPAPPWPKLAAAAAAAAAAATAPPPEPSRDGSLKDDDAPSRCFSSVECICASSSISHLDSSGMNAPPSSLDCSSCPSGPSPTFPLPVCWSLSSSSGSKSRFACRSSTESDRFSSSISPSPQEPAPSLSGRIASVLSATAAIPPVPEEVIIMSSFVPGTNPLRSSRSCCCWSPTSCSSDSTERSS
uniref:Putative secreted protein n=1 Tax=Anopheles triannulatus TaxID=58253 RepID=A0A2M4B233_9DIPT